MVASECDWEKWECGEKAWKGNAVQMRAWDVVELFSDSGGGDSSMTTITSGTIRWTMWNGNKETTMGSVAVKLGGGDVFSKNYNTGAATATGARSAVATAA